MTDPFATDAVASKSGGVGAADQVIDFSEVEDSDLIMPDHTATVRVSHAEPATSAKGHPKIALRWLLLDGAFAGRSIFEDISFAPAAIGISKGRLKKLGMPAAFRGTLAELCETIKGVEATGEIRTQKGRIADGVEYSDRNVIRKLTNIVLPEDPFEEESEEE